MKRYKCICAYDGTDWRGWQSQAGGNTIQDLLEKRLAQFLGAPTRIHASGRTDAGVHALAQVFHFDAEWKHGTEKMLRALRCGFPESIQVSKVSAAPREFHARYGVKRKTYVYRIYEGHAPPHLARYRWSLGLKKLDVGKMREAAAPLLGRHDFTAFSANNRCDISAEDLVKDLMRLDVTRSGREVKITTTASGYLYKMVRMLAGALVDVGLGKLEARELKDILDSKTRGSRFAAAPAQGLFLAKVYY